MYRKITIFLEYWKNSKHRKLPKHPIRYRRLPKSRLYTTIIQDFFGSYKGYAGVMQQYIFYYERSIRNGKF